MFTGCFPHRFLYSHHRFVLAFDRLALWHIATLVGENRRPGSGIGSVDDRRIPKSRFTV
jgi:hypothetical protein